MFTSSTGKFDLQSDSEYNKLFNKIERLIVTCKTLDHIETTKRYIQLADKNASDAFKYSHIFEPLLNMQKASIIKQNNDSTVI